MKNIPGWTQLTEQEYWKLSASDVHAVDCVQNVDGETYIPEAPMALQTLVHEWLEAVMNIWLMDRYKIKYDTWTWLTRTGEDARITLVKWGWLDDKGQPAEKSGYAWVNKEKP